MSDVVIGSIRGGVVEKYAEGDRWTGTVTTAKAATGGRVVMATAGHDRWVEDATADSLIAVGVAIHDAAAGGTVTVASEGVWMLTASGAITAGARVKAGAAGTVVAVAASVDPRLIIGIALADIADTLTGPVRLRF